MRPRRARRTGLRTAENVRSWELRAVADVLLAAVIAGLSVSPVTAERLAGLFGFVPVSRLCLRRWVDEVCKSVEVEEELLSERADLMDGSLTFAEVVDELLKVVDADASGRVDADASGRADRAGALEEAPAVPGYWMVFEGAVGVEFELSDGTGFCDELAGFRGLAGVCWTSVTGGLPEDIPLWDFPLSRTT